MSELKEFEEFGKSLLRIAQPVLFLAVARGSLAFCMDPDQFRPYGAMPTGVMLGLFVVGFTRVFLLGGKAPFVTIK